MVVEYLVMVNMKGLMIIGRLSVWFIVVVGWISSGLVILLMVVV